MMDAAITIWDRVVSGRPYWVDPKDDIETINFAQFIASDVAKKTTLDIGINITGSTRAQYVQSVMDEFIKVVRDKVEEGASLGGIMFKPNGSDKPSNCIDYIRNGDFIVTDYDKNGNIWGATFPDRIKKGKYYYTRLETQGFENGVYKITNVAYKTDNENDIGQKIDLQSVPEWADIMPEAYIQGLDKPLFSYFKMPANNNIDNESPLGVSIFANALKELKDLDIAWSRKGTEVADSKHITFMDNSTIAEAEQVAARTRKPFRLPRFIKEYDAGTGHEDKVHEHIATLLTESRIKDINSILSLISTKCGYSQGAFVLDRQSGRITATQVEADDQETIRTIKDIRDALQRAVNDLIYAIEKMADLNGLTVGKTEVSFAFGDLTYNWEEDRARHWQYVQSGKYPLWRYYVKFEGMSEEEAKAVVKEAQQGQKALFKEE